MGRSPSMRSVSPTLTPDTRILLKRKMSYRNPENLDPKTQLIGFRSLSNSLSIRFFKKHFANRKASLERYLQVRLEKNKQKRLYTNRTSVHVLRYGKVYVTSYF